MNENFDSIIFPGQHHLETGDGIVYDGDTASPIVIRNADGTTSTLAIDQIYYVRKIDDSTIKLFATRSEAQSPDVHTFLPASNVHSNNNTITLSGHGFGENQPVTYRNAITREFGVSLVDVQLDDTHTELDLDDDGNIQYNNSNSIFFTASHGFANGEAVQYHVTGDRPIGSLADGAIYYVIKQSDNAIQLAANYSDAVTNPTPIDISSVSSDSATRHTLTDPTFGLIPGRTYYVRDANQNTFRLAETPAGPAVELQYTPTDQDNSNSHQASIGTEGLDLLATPGAAQFPHRYYGRTGFRK